MKQGLLSGVVALALACAFGSASALEMSKHARDSDTLNAIALSGDVKIGDLFQLQAYISQLPKKDRMAVYLSSNGGNLYEGMKLGRFFYKAKVQTVVEGKGAHCLSACALAFLGGRDAKSGLASRTKTTTGILAFHSFAVAFDKDKQYTADDMSKIVQQTQKHRTRSRQLSARGPHRSRFSARDVPRLQRQDQCHLQ